MFPPAPKALLSTGKVHVAITIQSIWASKDPWVVWKGDILYA